MRTESEICAFLTFYTCISYRIWDSNAISDPVKDRMREVAKEKGVHLIVERCDDEPTTMLQGLSPRYQPFLEEK